MPKKEILKGSYCLIIRLEPESGVRIGKLGEINFKSGYYVYVGSALNSLRGRIKRHMQNDKKLFWHVDYLLNQKDAEIVEIIFSVSDMKWECKIASHIAKNAVSINNFGCSDCKCGSHLFYFEKFSDARNTCINTFKKLNLKPKPLKELNL
jgi:Uri superfamily endonuclease